MVAYLRHAGRVWLSLQLQIGSPYGAKFYYVILALNKHSYATSLNDAYTKTFVLYFNIFDKGTVNVYDRFYTELNRSNRYLLKHLRTFDE